MKFFAETESLWSRGPVTRNFWKPYSIRPRYSTFKHFRVCSVSTPTKRQVSKRQVSKRQVSKHHVSKRQVSKRPVSKRLKRKAYKTSGLQNVRFTKCQVYKTSGLQNVRLQNNIHNIFCTCGWWKSAGSVAAMFAGKVMAVFYSLF